MNKSITSTQTVHDSIADTLIDDIRGGLIAEGSTLPTERELCERFSTSRPTIRAALLTMQARGFVNLEAAKRPKACKPSLSSLLRTVGNELTELLGNAETIAHLEQIRQFIEVGAVRLAALSASNLQVAQIHAALEKGYMALDNDTAFAKADAEFHRAIVSVIRNPIILELHDRFVVEVLANRSAENYRNSDNRISYEEHRQIYEAIAANEPERAMSVTDRHLARSFRDRLPEPARLNIQSESG